MGWQGLVDRWRQWRGKPYVPRADIPERNDKKKSADRKDTWDFGLFATVEALFFISFWLFGQFIGLFGFLFGFLATVVAIMVPLVILFFLKMRATVNRSNRMGRYPPYNLVAFNKQGKKYEDHFFRADLQEVLADAKTTFLGAVEYSNQKTPATNPKGRLFEVKGAFRHNKPLEEFHILTQHPWGAHVEHASSTETVSQGSVAIKKEMPYLVLRQIGTYGEHKLPLMRVESSCVSRRDEPLFGASLHDVAKADQAIDTYRSKTMEEDLVRLEKTVASQKETIDKLKDARARDKKERDQQRVIGEDAERDAKRKSRLQIALPYLAIIASIFLTAAICFLVFRVYFGV